MLQELHNQVAELYSKADHDVEQYRMSTGLTCPAGCVSCCQSDKVETSILEMIPLAHHLFRTQQAELLLKRLELPDLPKCCILFRPDLVGSLGGGCSQYQYRALVCRLFGFAGSVDRSGTIRLAYCRVMRDSTSLSTKLLHNEFLPVFSEFGVAVSAMHPSLGNRRLPINEALREALLMAGLEIQYKESPADRLIDVSSCNEPFDPPHQPRKRAA